MFGGEVKAVSLAAKAGANMVIVLVLALMGFGFYYVLTAGAKKEADYLESANEALIEQATLSEEFEEERRDLEQQVAKGLKTIEEISRENRVLIASVIDECKGGEIIWESD